VSPTASPLTRIALNTSDTDANWQPFFIRQGPTVAEIFPDYDITNVEDIINDKVGIANEHLPSFKQVSDIKFRKNEFAKTTTKKIKRTY
jgi:cell envelope opacity-associated protein A